MCEVCSLQNARYTCPKCEIKTCCLSCSKVHKKELDCSGLRDRTKYIPLKNMTKVDFMNDYYFLEECTKFVKDKKDNKKVKPRHHGGISKSLHTLKKVASDRKIRLLYMVGDLTRRKENRTIYDSKKQVILWHLELIFVNANNLKVSARIEENQRLSDVVLSFLKSEDPAIQKSLEFYKSSGIKNLKVLFKAEGLKGDQYFVLDLEKSLKKNLTNKVVIEFPTFQVIMDHSVGDFQIVDEDDLVLDSEFPDFQKTIFGKVFDRNLEGSGLNPPIESPSIESTGPGVAGENEKPNSDEEIEPENFLFSKSDF